MILFQATKGDINAQGLAQGISELPINDGSKIVENKDLGLESPIYPEPVKLLPVEEMKASPSANEEQEKARKMLIKFIYAEVNTGKGNFFFLNGQEGTGKTWLLHQTLNEVLSKGDIAVHVSGSGNDACLYDGGCKVKVPFSLAQIEALMSTIESDDSESDSEDDEIDDFNSLNSLLRRAKVIVWDVVENHNHYRALDRYLRNVCNKKVPFADIPVLLAGDLGHPIQNFQEIPAQEVKACLEPSHQWALLGKYFD